MRPRQWAKNVFILTPLLFAAPLGDFSPVAHCFVALFRARPETVLADCHRLMNLAGYRAVAERRRETTLKINVSWQHFFPACSTTPWQLEGVIGALRSDGYDLPPSPSPLPPTWGRGEGDGGSPGAGTCLIPESRLRGVPGCPAV
jgi:hypothetical protein